MYIFSSLLGVKKSLGHAQIDLLQGFYSKFPTSIGVPPPPGHESHMALDVMYLQLVSSTAMTSVMRILVVLPCWLVSPVTCIFIRSTIQSHIFFFHTVTIISLPVFNTKLVIDKLINQLLLFAYFMNSGGHGTDSRKFTARKLWCSSHQSLPFLYLRQEAKLQS